MHKHDVAHPGPIKVSFFFSRFFIWLCSDILIVLRNFLSRSIGICPSSADAILIVAPERSRYVKSVSNCVSILRKKKNKKTANANHNKLGSNGNNDDGDCSFVKLAGCGCATVAVTFCAEAG
jgi:hypothetical protein